MSLNITEEELTAIKFYLGDLELVRKNVYRGGGKAYQTINALLNYGYRNEVDKAKEGKTVELYDTSHLKSYLNLINLVFDASLKYRNMTLNSGKSFNSYRVDRLSSFKEFTSHNGIIQGFFSTCKYGLLPQYANSKKDVVLLEVVRDPSVPYLDFQDLLNDFYSKPEEAEILVPFGTIINSITEEPLSDEEKELYHDADGNPPRGKWVIKLTQGEYKEIDANLEASYYDYICSEDVLARIIEIMKKLTAREELSEDEITLYSDWKEKLIAYIDNCASKAIKKHAIDDINYSRPKRGI